MCQAPSPVILSLAVHCRSRLRAGSAEYQSGRPDSGPTYAAEPPFAVVIAASNGTSANHGRPDQAIDFLGRLEPYLDDARPLTIPDHYRNAQWAQ